MWLYSDMQHRASLRLVCLYEEENRPVTPTPCLIVVADQKTALFLDWGKKKQQTNQKT